MTSGETNGEDGTLSNGKMHFAGLLAVWSPFGQGVDLHNDQRPRSVRGVLKMRIMHGHLGEVSVRGTSERMWKDEV